ncbi:MAG: SDR family oxidoreductase [Promethearchaeota archaeon]
MSSKKDKKVVFITGCSSGFGYLAARRLARDGHVVYATMRDVSTRNKGVKEDLEQFASESDPSLEIKVVECDVLDVSSVNAAVQAMVDSEGRVDVLVNNAGYGLIGPVECAPEDKIRHQFDTNVFGVIRTIKAVLPHMRARRSGLIINVSSVGGRLGIPLEGIYCATKFAVEGLSEALLGECYLFGINVTLLEPHAFGTGFMGRSLKLVAEPSETGEYSGPFGYFTENITKFVHKKSDPREVADKISWIVKQKNPPFRVPVGPNARRDSTFAKIIKPLTLQKMAARMYGMKDLFKKVPRDSG